MIAFFGHHNWRSQRARDYYGFWVVGQAVKTMPVTNVYGDLDRQRIGEHFYRRAVEEKAPKSLINAAAERRAIIPTGTPFFYSVFDILSGNDYEADYEIFRHLSFGVYIVSILVLCHMFGFSKFNTILMVILCSELFKPFLRDMLEGNVNQIQVGILTLILWLRSKKENPLYEIATGLAIGLLIMFKPNLALIYIFLSIGTIFFRSIKQSLLLTGGLGGGMIIGYIMPILFFGRVCDWSHWRAGLSGMALDPKYVQRSLLSMVFGIRDSQYFYVFMFLLILIPFIMIVLNRKVQIMKWRVENEPGKIPGEALNWDVMMIGFAVCVYLLSSPFVHFHYFLLIVPLILFAVRPAQGTYSRLPRRDFDRILIGVLCYLLFNIVVYHSGYPGGGLYFTYWPFAYISTGILYTWSLANLLGGLKSKAIVD